MKQKVLKGERIEKVEGFEIGSLLLYDAPEWRSRALAARRVFTVELLRRFSVLWAIICSFLLIMVFVPSLGPANLGSGIFIGLVPGLVLSVVLPLGLIIIYHRNARGDPVPGLYSKGMMLYNRIFVPYREVGGIKEKVQGSSLFGRIAMVYLLTKEKGEESPFYNLLAITRDFLGDRGVGMVRDLVGAQGADEGPPKLVVYREGGGVAKEEYVPEPEDA